VFRAGEVVGVAAGLGVSVGGRGVAARSEMNGGGRLVEGATALGRRGGGGGGRSISDRSVTIRRCLSLRIKLLKFMLSYGSLHVVV